MESLTVLGTHPNLVASICGGFCRAAVTRLNALAETVFSGILVRF
jgi:hypothetical protein